MNDFLQQIIENGRIRNINEMMNLFATINSLRNLTASNVQDLQQALENTDNAVILLGNYNTSQAHLELANTIRNTLVRQLHVQPDEVPVSGEADAANHDGQ